MHFALPSHNKTTWLACALLMLVSCDSKHNEAQKATRSLAHVLIPA